MRRGFWQSIRWCALQNTWHVRAVCRRPGTSGRGKRDRRQETGSWGREGGEDEAQPSKYHAEGKSSHGARHRTRPGSGSRSRYVHNVAWMRMRKGQRSIPLHLLHRSEKSLGGCRRTAFKVAQATKIPWVSEVWHHHWHSTYVPGNMHQCNHRRYCANVQFNPNLTMLCYLGVSKAHTSKAHGSGRRRKATRDPRFRTLVLGMRGFRKIDGKSKFSMVYYLIF